MTALQAQATFTPQEAKAFKELPDIVRRHNRDTLEWYWSLGVRVTAIQTDAKKNKEHYGAKVLDRMSAALGFKSSGPLYQAHKVIEAYGTKKAFLEYTKLAGEAGNTLTWGHIAMLAGLSDASMRLELAGTCLEQGWTVDMLHQQISKLVNRKPRGIRKATPQTKIPSSVKKCLAHITGQAEAFVHAVNESWTGDAFNIKAMAEDIPTSNLNEALLEDIAATQKKLLDMIASAEEMDEQLEEAEAVVRRKLAAQAEIDAAAEMEAIAAAGVEESEEDDDDSELEEDDAVEVVYDEDEDEGRSLEDDAAEDEDDGTTFINEELALQGASDEEEVVSIGAQRNAAVREQRAIQRARERVRKVRGR